MPSIAEWVRPNSFGAAASGCYCSLQQVLRRRAAKIKPMAANAANANVEGSGTAAGPAKLAVAANAALAPDADPELSALESNASRLEPPSMTDEESAATDALAGSTASTRLSSKLTSKPGSVAASRSIAAMRFSST